MADFSQRPYQGLFAPPETPALSPPPLAGGAPALPPSLAGPPAPANAGGSGGGAGAYDWTQFLKQIMPILPMLLAKSPGAKAAFLEGYERAQRMNEQRQMEERRLDMTQQQIDLRAGEHRALLDEREQDRTATQENVIRQRAKELMQGYAQVLGKISSRGEFDQQLQKYEATIAGKFPGLVEPGTLAGMVGPYQVNTTKADKFLENALRLPDERALDKISSSEFADYARQMGIVYDFEGQPQLNRKPEAASTTTLTPERQAAALRAEARELKRQGKGAEAAAKNVEADAITKDMRAWNIGSTRPPVTAGAPEDTETLARMLFEGDVVPGTLSKRAASYNATLAKATKISLAETGKPLNFNKLTLDYEAAKRFVGTMNSTQMVRFFSLAESVVNTIDEVRQLGDELQQGSVQLWNKAKRDTILQVYGNTPQSGIAARYIGAVNTLVEEFANLAMGGFAPTEAAWKLANSQINTDFGANDLQQSLVEVKRLINFRVKAFEDQAPRLVPEAGQVSAETSNDPLGIR